MSVILESFSKEDADAKDDVKVAWCAHLWMCHAISTPISRRLWRRVVFAKALYYIWSKTFSYFP